MKRFLALLLIFAITFVVPSAGLQPLPSGSAATSVGLFQDYQQQDNQQYDTYFSSDQLENLVAPIALYPDPLLAQVLLAATFPDQIDEAARTVRAYGSGYDIDSAPWDVSVKAVAHYPTVLSMMADKIDWTTSLGQAYVNQSSDLMDAVQRLRQQARSGGYLVNSPQQEIVETDGYLYIYPAQPEYIYVPYYDPAIVFVSYPGYRVGPAIWFGAGFLIGAWLNHDCDWGHHRVFYHGWGGGGPVWIGRSRPHVHINNIYVNDRYRNVEPNRHVLDRHVNYGALNRYNSVHHDVDYNNVRRARGDTGSRPAQVAPGDQRGDNKIIRRSMDPNDPRINANRGRGQIPQSQPQVQQPNVPRPEVRRPETPQVSSLKLLDPTRAAQTRRTPHRPLPCPCRYPEQLSHRHHGNQRSRGRRQCSEAAVLVRVPLIPAQPASAAKPAASSRASRFSKQSLLRSNMPQLHSTASKLSRAEGVANETTNGPQQPETGKGWTYEG